jgi:Winged helix DNA-binding domain
MDSITSRQLNRATLARQMLLARESRPAIDAVEHLLGLQAQAPFPPYFGLWSRLAGFDPMELAGLIERREVVRIAAMRSTVHLLSARDALWLRSILQPALERMLGSSMFGKELAAIDRHELIEAGRALVDESPRTGSQISTLLADRWPDLNPLTIQNAIRTHLALVQVPPRGVWGRAGQATLTTVEAWLGMPVPHPAPAEAVESMVLRYLAAFGPASVADIQVWSGLTRLSEIVERLRPRLTHFTGPTGTKLYDQPDAPRPPDDTPAPARIIAEFDNLTLSYADRSRVLSTDDRRRAYANNGIIPAMVLVDGVVAGVAKLTRTRTAATVTLTYFRKIHAADRAAVEQEAAGMLAFAAPEAAHDIRVV